ncbi:hypothetical protein HanRHA438_Chr12g0558511 [Helianthus annuus]|nr:hypothetical protein HanRHA438_Chr12g0558511 [Helianthus annuus]
MNDRMKEVPSKSQHVKNVQFVRKFSNLQRITKQTNLRLLLLVLNINLFQQSHFSKISFFCTNTGLASQTES